MKNLSLHILDIVQNSIRAGAKLIRIEIEEQAVPDQLMICISDNGSGMDEELAERAIDPFFTSRTSRKVGLGLSLFKQNAEMTGGSFKLESELGKGTKVTAIFRISHLDCPVMGELGEILQLLICSPEDADYVFSYQTPDGFFELDSRDIKLTIGEIPINHPDIRRFIGQMIQENLEQIKIRE